MALINIAHPTALLRPGVGGVRGLVEGRDSTRAAPSPG